MPSRDKDSYCIQSVENALDVLEALCDEDEDVRISRLSEKLQMNKTSVFRLLATFESRGYVERKDDSGKYRLGLSAYEIGQKLLSRMGLLRQAHPVMERFVRDCDETLYLAVQRDREVLFLDMVDTSQQVKIVSLVGKRFPLQRTAPGQLLLALTPDSVSTTGDETLPPAKAELIRKNGYVLETGGLGEGICCLATPLFESGGKLNGSLCLVGPDFRLTKERIETDLLPKLKETSAIISSKLGFHNPYLSRQI
ncbi:MAG: IclR family transcriptional regulator [Desulfuromonas sp.]|nr:MAG: IclR family transcriptional regulator [Desulfuromonas sp.]